MLLKKERDKIFKVCCVCRVYIHQGNLFSNLQDSFFEQFTIQLALGNYYFRCLFLTNNWQKCNVKKIEFFEGLIMPQEMNSSGKWQHDLTLSSSDFHHIPFLKVSGFVKYVSISKSTLDLYFSNPLPFKTLLTTFKTYLRTLVHFHFDFRFLNCPSNCKA